MSLIKAIKAQLGLSVTPANNFTLDASADNGTMKLARNSGQDIMTVAADGTVDFPQLGQSSTFTKLPGGALICWGALVTNAGGGATITYPATFVGSNPLVVCSFANGSPVAVCLTIDSSSLGAASVYTQLASGAGVAATVVWAAFGRWK